MKRKGLNYERIISNIHSIELLSYGQSSPEEINSLQEVKISQIRTNWQRDEVPINYRGIQVNGKDLPTWGWLVSPLE